MILKMKNKFNHLSINERYKIKEMKDKGMNITEIANNLNRAKSSISMEIMRNKHNREYLPCKAHLKYCERLHQKDGLKIEKNPDLISYITCKMRDNYCAPDVISGMLKAEENLPNISTESIYNFIYTSPIASTLGLYIYLPTKRRKREERGKRRQRVIIPARTSIHEREAIANQKIEIGHFDGDLTFHKGNQSSNIGCIVDKKSQKVFLIKNSSKRTATVTAGFLSKMMQIPEKARKTLTLDNGKEFVRHVSYRLLGFKTYFCDAYRPRQKALVEKMNSMIHRIIPKNIDINTITQEVLDNVEDILNNMPRKIFGYKTPNQVWNENL
jgi:IS30 family transposase